MLKKYFIGALLLLASFGFAQTANSNVLAVNATNKQCMHSCVFDNISLVAVRGKEFRYGIGYNLYQVPISGFNPINVDVWVLTNRRGEKLFGGLGVSTPVYSNRNATLSLTAGWSTQIDRMRSNGEWGIGVSLGIRF